MRALTFHSSPHADRSFNIGLGLVVLFAVAEIFSAGFYYLGRMRPVRTVTAPAPAAAPLRGAAPSAPPVKLTVASPVPLPPVAPAMSPVISPSTAALSAAARLFKEATALQQRGDTTTALARLQEASEKDPKNAQILAEMATIYESIQNFDRSAATWRRIVEIGPSAGPAYELAETKLKTGVPLPSAMGPGLAGTPSLSTVPLHPDAKGFSAGSTLQISDVQETETPDPDADTNLMLRIGVKKRANAVIDHTKVKIQVFFYDTVGESPQPVLTDADVGYEWLTPNHDWANAETETLAVTYVRPKNKVLSSEAALTAAAAAINPAKKGKSMAKATPPADAGQRKYLGYIVRVYYNDKLQAARANPSKLLNLYPPPSTATSQ
jgi:tetratricopeptide (TPR) repeat protein